MAPIEPSPTAQAEVAIRDTIQSLYNVMLHTSAYDAAGPHTTLDALVAEVHVLSKALKSAAAAADSSGNSSGGAGGNRPPLPSVPRDLVQYVEAGRNPDIYTREFVELVRRTNQLRAGKRAAFVQFRDVLAGQIRSALPELQPDVDRVLESTGGEEDLQDSGDSGESEKKSSGEQLSTSAPTNMAIHAAPAFASSAAPTSAPHGPSTTGTTLANTNNNNNNNNSNRSVSASVSASASASASPPVGLAGGTPGSDAGGSTIDMLGMLPGTPQAGAPALPPPPTATTTTTTATSSGIRPDGNAMQTT